MSTPSPCVILYDVDGKSGSRPWNTMSLRTRFALEYKRIPYRTIWLEYPDIEPTLRGIGAKAGAIKPTDGSPLYTIPVIADEIHPGSDGKPTVVTDSWVIAEYLDEMFPDRPLFPKGTKALQWLWQETSMKDIVMTSAAMILPRFYLVLNEESKPYFRNTREGYFQKKLEEMCPRGSQQWEETWKSIEKALNTMAVTLDKNGPQSENPYVMGKDFSYADIAIGTALYSLHALFPGEWENVKKWNNGRWGLIEETCAAFATET